MTSTTVEENFYKGLINGPWDLVLVADQIIDVENADYQFYLASGGSIFVLTSQSGGNLQIDLHSTVRAMQQVFKDLPGTVACFIAFLDCRLYCLVTTDPLSPARVQCDQQCDQELIDCLAAA